MKIDVPHTVVKSGENLTLRCAVVSVPPANLSWSARYAGSDSMEPIGHGADYIATVTSNQSGVYMCQARNPETGVTQNQEVNVEVKPGT